MRIEISDPHLNVFWHYRGGPTYEDNITRALMVLVSRPPTAVDVLNSLLCAIRDSADVQSNDASTFRRALGRCMTDCEHVEITLQEPSGAEAEDQEDPPYLICVGLQPTDQFLGDEGETGRSVADAIMRLSLTDSPNSPVAVCVTLETKLYGGAWEEQVRNHGSHIKAGKPDAVVLVQWAELYRILRKRTAYLDGDLLLQDFDELVARFPRLTGWTGLRPDDLDREESGLHRVAVKVEQLSHQLLARAEEAGTLYSLQSQRGADFSFWSEGPESSAGNLGIACWNSSTLSMKLVAGAKRFRECSKWTRLLEPHQAGRLERVAEQMRELVECATRSFPRARVRLQASYRLKRYQVTRFYGCQNIEVGETNLMEGLRQALEMAAKIDRKRLEQEDLHRIASSVADSTRFTETFSSELSAKAPVEGWWQYPVFNVFTDIDEEDITAYQSDDMQVIHLSKVLEATRKVLLATVESPTADS